VTHGLGHPQPQLPDGPRLGTISEVASVNLDGRRLTIGCWQTMAASVYKKSFASSATTVALHAVCKTSVWLAYGITLFDFVVYDGRACSGQHRPHRLGYGSMIPADEGTRGGSWLPVSVGARRVKCLWVGASGCNRSSCIAETPNDVWLLSRRRILGRGRELSPWAPAKRRHASVGALSLSA